MQKIPGAVWALGFVSMFMDISSEMIHGLLPAFLVSVLGASALTLGIIEGTGESLALFMRLLSGVFSDYLKRRKPLVFAGYLLGAISKPLFAMAGTSGFVLFARALDRFGKGLRGASRDALIADLAPAGIRGAAFGLRQSLDSVGAVIGPLLAILLMWWRNNNFREVFWLAIIPGLISVLIIALFVREPPRCKKGPVAGFRLMDVGKLSSSFWLVLAVGLIFTLARFSEAFLLLRSQEVGLVVHLIPVMLIIMSFTYALGAYPAGVLSDRLGRMAVLLSGMVVLIITHLILGFSTRTWHVAAGAAAWGMHLALTQGIFAALVADTSPSLIRGSAFGLFSFGSGLAILLASVLAGLLWDYSGSRVAFFTGAGFALAALLGGVLLLFRFNSREKADPPMNG